MEIVAVNIAETVQFLPKVMKWQLNNQTDYIQLIFEKKKKIIKPTTFKRLNLWKHVQANILPWC